MKKITFTKAEIIEKIKEVAEMELQAMDKVDTSSLPIASKLPGFVDEKIISMALEASKSDIRGARDYMIGNIELISKAKGNNDNLSLEAYVLSEVKSLNMGIVEEAKEGNPDDLADLMSLASIVNKLLQRLVESNKSIFADGVEYLISTLDKNSILLISYARELKQKSLRKNMTDKILEIMRK